MASAVLHVGDQRGGSARGTLHLHVHDFAKGMDQADIGPFVEPADVVGIPGFPFMVNEVDGPGVVNNIQPVADVLSLPVNRDRLHVLYIIDCQRNKFFRKLIRTVIVGAVGKHHRKPVGMVIGTHKVVGACFGSRIGAPRVVGGRLHKEALIAQRTVNFVG